jgi:hypothetical protein
MRILRAGQPGLILAVVLAGPGVAAWGADAMPAKPPAEKKKPARPAASPSPSPSPSPGAPRRVFTDEDLPGSAKKAEEAREHAKEGKTASPTPPPDPGLAATEQAAREEEERRREADRQAEVQSEAEWRQRIGDARSRRKSAEANVARLEAELSRLAGEILLSTDTNRILMLQEQRRKVQAELDTAKAEAASAVEAIAAIEEEARRKGTPSHWLREP